MAPKFIERLLSNVGHAEEVTFMRKIETYKQFSSMLARGLHDYHFENHQVQENESLPRIFPFSKKGQECFHGLLDIIQHIFFCGRNYLSPTQGRIIVGAQGPPVALSRYWVAQQARLVGVLK